MVNHPNRSKRRLDDMTKAYRVVSVVGGIQSIDDFDRRSEADACVKRHICGKRDFPVHVELWSDASGLIKTTDA